MPLITIRYAATTEVTVSSVVAAVTDASSTILRKNPAVTAVIAEPADPAHWFVAGRSLAELGAASFWLDIHVTAGTNSKEEKEQFIARLFQTMGTLLGNLHTESYVHVHEVSADAYGFGGVTQERRFIESHPVG